MPTSLHLAGDGRRISAGWVTLGRRTLRELAIRAYFAGVGHAFRVGASRVQSQLVLLLEQQ